jgi:cyclophilin family peptidyl-prolyl cis-trans isomerase
MHHKSIFIRFFIFFLCACSPLLTVHAKSPKENEPTPPFPKVIFQTSLGTFTVELYPKEAPKTVENFLQYVDDGFYVGTIFHRVIPGFVVQGGGITYDFQPKNTRDPVVNEANNGLLNFEATLSMARTSDPDSADSQFFINLKHNDSLDYKKDESDGYTVFAKVVEGFDVVKKIEKEPRGLYRSRPDAPNYPVIIEAAQRIPSE